MMSSQRESQVRQRKQTNDRNEKNAESRQKKKKKKRRVSPDISLKQNGTNSATKQQVRKYAFLLPPVIMMITSMIAVAAYNRRSFIFGTGGRTTPKSHEPSSSLSGSNTKSKDGSTNAADESKIDDADSVSVEREALSNMNPYGLSFSPDNYQVLEVLPHDSNAFTQGLTYYKRHLYEGTGLNGRSEIRKLHQEDPSTSIQTKPIPSIPSSSYFGEGITYYRNKNDQPRFLQLTWQHKTGFIYHADTLQLLHQFDYNTRTGEGWGVTYNEEREEFVVSDGSEYLHFWDRDTLIETRKVRVMLASRNIPIRYLNELELVTITTARNKKETRILANVWYEDIIVEIDPISGDVTKVYDLEGLYQNRISHADCLNGISIANETQEHGRDGSIVVYVTGKFWPHMFKIKLLPTSQ